MRRRCGRRFKALLESLRTAVQVDAGAGIWGEYGAGQADCGGRGAGGRLPPDARVLGGEGHPRRSAGGGGAQVCGGLPARQYPVSDAAAGDAVAERAAGAGRGFDGRGAVDRDAADVLRLPAAGVCGVGGGRRPVQGQGRRHRPGPGPADPAGAEKQPHLHRRLRRIFGQMPPVDQPEPRRGRGRGDADPAPC